MQLAQVCICQSVSPDYGSLLQQLHLKQLTQLMTKVTSEKKKCYFMGDFNINIPMDEHNDNTCTLLDIMYSMSFIPLITRPTRITSTSATFIDNIFCNILLNNNTRVNGVL